MGAIAVFAIALAALIAYRRLTQPPPAVLEFLRKNPDQPQPELVAWGMSPALVWLILAIAVTAVAIVVAIWRWRASH